MRKSPDDLFKGRYMVGNYISVIGKMSLQTPIFPINPCTELHLNHTLVFFIN